MHPNHDIREHEHLIKYFHAGIESPDEFLRHSGMDIIARVSVTWSSRREEVALDSDRARSDPSMDPVEADLRKEHT